MDDEPSIERGDGELDDGLDDAYVGGGGGGGGPMGCLVELLCPPLWLVNMLKTLETSRLVLCLTVMRGLGDLRFFCVLTVVDPDVVVVVDDEDEEDDDDDDEDGGVSM